MRCSAATAATSSGVTRFSSSRRSGQVSRKLSGVCRSSKMSAPVIFVIALRRFVVELRAEECVGRKQRADAHAGDDAECRAACRTCVQPLSRPAANAPSAPPPDIASHGPLVGGSIFWKPSAVSPQARTSGKSWDARGRCILGGVRCPLRQTFRRRLRRRLLGLPWLLALAFFLRLRLRVSAAGSSDVTTGSGSHDATHAKLRPRARLATTRFTAGLRSDQTLDRASNTGPSRRADVRGRRHCVWLKKQGRIPAVGTAAGRDIAEFREGVIRGVRRSNSRNNGCRWIDRSSVPGPRGGSGVRCRWRMRCRT